MSTAVSLGGWVTAGIVALVLVSLCRLLSIRTEAVARACHELRGPLAAARLGLTLGPGTRELPPGRLRAIDTELGRAALALDDLADPRRRAPQLRRCERVDVHSLLSDSVEAWQASADAAGVSLQMAWSGPRAVVWGDRLRLAQATGNLIANAIEHGGGAVAVQGSARVGVVRIVVRDGGPGLPGPVVELCRRDRRRHGRDWGRGGRHRGRGRDWGRGGRHRGRGRDWGQGGRDWGRGGRDWGRGGRDWGRDGRAARGRGLAIATEVALAHRGQLVSAPSERGACLVLELPAATGQTRPTAG